MLDEQSTALLQREEGVRHGLAVFVGDQHPIVTLGNLALDDVVAIEDVAHQPGAAGHGEKLALKTDQAACRDTVFESNSAETAPRGVTLDHHVEQLTTSRAELGHHAALQALVDVDGQCLEGLLHHAINNAP